jgi:hypothetical protein
MKRSMHHTTPIGLLLIGLVIVGCGQKNPLVGTWTGSKNTPQGVTMNTTLTLTDDGKDTASTSFSGPNGNNKIDANGTYTVSGNTLTQTYTMLSANGRQVPQSKGPIPEPSTFTLDGDTLTLVNSKYGVTQVLTRQK